MLGLKKVPIVLSNSVNTDTGGAKENVQIKWVDLTDKDFLYPGTKQTIRNNQVSVLLVTNIDFLLTLSIHFQEIRLGELIK